jgi:hypothetical protein
MGDNNDNDNDIVVAASPPRSSIDASSSVAASDLSCDAAFGRLPDEIIQQYVV